MKFLSVRSLNTPVVNLESEGCTVSCNLGIKRLNLLPCDFESCLNLSVCGSLQPGSVQTTRLLHSSLSFHYNHLIILKSEMLWLLVALCFMWEGTCSFLILNSADSLCLEDSLTGSGVQLKRCSVDSDLQQWVWSDRWFLINVNTQRCLSGYYDEPVQTVECDGENDLQWQCFNHKLISMNRSLELGAHRGRLTLTDTGKSTRWRTVEEGDICQEKLRSRRQSETDDFEDVKATMTEEQREYLRWYYRTEDPAGWKFAMLALSLVALLLGCVLCVMGTMGNKHRNKLAAYKAAASSAHASTKTEMEELQAFTEIKEEKNFNEAQTENAHSNSAAVVQVINENEVLKAGEIKVTWKDGNVSTLYPDTQQEKEDAN